MSNPATTKQSHRKFIWIAALVTIVWLLVGGSGGPLFGSLASVEKNDTSKFLPSNVESQRASDVIVKFSTTTANNVYPALILFEGSATPAKVASANAFIQGLVTKDLVDSKGNLIKDKDGSTLTIPISKYLVQGAPYGAFANPQKTAILANLPFPASVLSQSLSNKQSVIAAVVTAVRYYANQFATQNGFVTQTTGQIGIFSDLIGVFSGIDGSLLFGTLIVVALILISVYRSPVLWILPLFSAVFALSLSVLVIYQLAKHNIITLSGQSQGILFVLVLGAATDYALLLISRYREELHNFEHRVDAMKVAWRGVVEPIVASGSTVTLGLLVLLLSQHSDTKGLGPVGAIGIICAMLTILTLLPALLVLFGRWIFWPKRPRFGTEDEKLSGLWSKVANSTEKSPRKYFAIATLVLVVLAAFSTTLHANGISSDQEFTKKTDSIIGEHDLTKYFSAGQDEPTQVIISASDAREFATKIQSLSGVGQIVPQTVTPIVPGQPIPAPKLVDGNVLLNVTLSYAPDSKSAVNLIPQIRKIAHGIDPNSLVGGITAFNYDIDQAASHDEKVIIPVILLLIALILGILLRSIVASLLLLASVVISFLATLGACSVVFHHLFHFAGEDTSFPLYAFVFLVALGIDYNIFLMTRVREETIKGGTRFGVTRGVTVTGGVITSAGIVLAATFALLSILPLVFLAEVGFAVGFGVLLDTLVVRSILVPALVHSIGPKVWWPSKLQHE